MGSFKITVRLTRELSEMDLLGRVCCYCFRSIYSLSFHLHFTLDEQKKLHWENRGKETQQFSTTVSTFPCGSADKESTCNAGDPGLIPVLGRFPGEGNHYPLQYSCLENSMDRGAWRSTVHGGCKESDVTEQPTLICFNNVGMDQGWECEKVPQELLLLLYKK